MLLSVHLLAACNLLRPDERGDLLEHHIFVEVDGKPYEIKRTIQHWKTYSWDASRGNVTGSRSDYGIFGQRIHDNQAVVIQFNYRRSSEQDDWAKSDDGKMVLSDPEHLKSEFVIYLLDHYKNPQMIEMYNSVEAFDSPNARVKVTLASKKHIPKIPFWIFQGNGKDRYYDYVLKSSSVPSKKADKNFVHSSVQIREISDESVRTIYQEFPELKEVEIYRLEKNHRGGRVFSLVGQKSPCSEYSCFQYFAKQQNDTWYVDRTNKQLSRAYYISGDVGVEELQKKKHVFQFMGNEIHIKREPGFRNVFLDFQKKELRMFNIGYFHTREHKKK